MRFLDKYYLRNCVLSNFQENYLTPNRSFSYTLDFLKHIFLGVKEAINNLNSYFTICSQSLFRAALLLDLQLKSKFTIIFAIKVSLIGIFKNDEGSLKRLIDRITLLTNKIKFIQI